MTQALATKQLVPFDLTFTAKETQNSNIEVIICLKRFCAH